MTQIDKSQGLTCPNCSGVVPVPEGARIVACPYCQMHALVQGERGVRRWQVSRTLERKDAAKAVYHFFSGMKKAPNLKREAKIRDVFLVYLPYWRVQAFVAGWRFGRVKSGEKSTKPIEIEIAEEMHWNDAAVDVSEFGVHCISLSKTDLLPYDTEALHAEAMVFEPTESHTDAMTEAEQHFIFRAHKKQKLRQKFSEKFHFLRPQLSLVYYPLWVTRYEYHHRNYQVVVDGRSGSVLYGKAPGNILYRAGALVAGLAAGNLVLVNGTLLALWAASTSDDGDLSLAVFLFPLLIGLGLITAGYRAFRYGEEVEELSAENKKAMTAGDANSNPFNFSSGSDMLKTGLNILEELSEYQ